MSIGAGQFGMPGVASATFTTTAELFWGGDESRIQILRLDAYVDQTAVDAGASPTSVLRPGLLLGRVTASGRVKQWDVTATDGSETLIGVNAVEQSMIDAFGTAVGRFAPMIVQAPLKASALLIGGSALVGHADEYVARRRLAEMGCRLDDDPQNFLAGLAERRGLLTATGAITAAQNGTYFHCGGSAARVITLPAIKAGLRFKFLNAVNQDLTISSAAGDDVMIVNDAEADSVAASTANQKIGVILTVYAVRTVNAAGAQILRWVVEPSAVGTATLTTAT